MQIEVFGKRAIHTLLGIGLLLALWETFYAPASFLNAGAVQAAVGEVARIAPAVSVMSAYATDPIRARAVFAVEWAMFPIYLALFLWAFRPWNSRSRPLRLRSGMTPAKVAAGAIIGVLYLGAMVSSDLRMTDFAVGLMRGGMFIGPPRTLPILLSAPLVSRAAMVLYAWFLPFANAFCYFALTTLAVNFDRYFNLENQDGPNLG